MSEAAANALLPPQERRASLLFVDDERRVLNSMRAMFRRDYTVFLANSGPEALELLEKESIDVVVSDQRMPGMSGVDVLKAFKEHAPNAMRILLTGYADEQAITDSINEGEVFRYLTKPCPRESITEAIALAVEATALAVEATNGLSSLAPTVTELETPELRHAEDEQRRLAVRQPAPAVVEQPVPALASELQCGDVELLLLSSDMKLIQGLVQAVNQAHVIHAVESIDEAVALLEKYPIGVLVTDMAVNADEIQGLTSDLKQLVPELVTVVASDHSDAHRMIELINGGQVFRFLLKPIKPKQTSIWIESAVVKYVQLVKNPELVARHVVQREIDSAFKRLGDQLLGVASRVMRFRDRVIQSSEA